jgi:hypothetical protein
MVRYMISAIMGKSWVSKNALCMRVDTKLRERRSAPSNRGLTYLCDRDLMMRFRVTSEPNPWSANPTLPDSSGSTGPGFHLYNSAALGLIPRTTRSRRHCLIRERREIQLRHTVLKHLRWQHNDPKKYKSSCTKLGEGVPSVTEFVPETLLALHLARNLLELRKRK